MGIAVVGSKLYMFGGVYLQNPPKLPPSMATYAFDLAASASVLKHLPDASLNGEKFLPTTAVIEKGGREYICALRTRFMLKGPNIELFDPERESWSGLPEPFLGYGSALLQLQGCYVCKSRLCIWIGGKGGYMLDLDNDDKGWSPIPAPVPREEEMLSPCGFAIGDGTFGWWPTFSPMAFSFLPIGKPAHDVPVTFYPAREWDLPFPFIPVSHARVGDRYLCIVDSLTGPQGVVRDLKAVEGRKGVTTYIGIVVYSIRLSETGGLDLHQICSSILAIEVADCIHMESFVTSWPRHFSDSQICKPRSSVTWDRKRFRNAPQPVGYFGQEKILKCCRRD